MGSALTNAPNQAMNGLPGSVVKVLTSLAAGVGSPGTCAMNLTVTTLLDSVAINVVTSTRVFSLSKIAITRDFLWNKVSHVYERTF